MKNQKKPKKNQVKKTLSNKTKKTLSKNTKKQLSITKNIQNLYTQQISKNILQKKHLRGKQNTTLKQKIGEHQNLNKKQKHQRWKI